MMLVEKCVWKKVISMLLDIDEELEDNIKASFVMKLLGIRPILHKKYMKVTKGIFHLQAKLNNK